MSDEIFKALRHAIGGLAIPVGSVDAMPSPVPQGWLEREIAAAQKRWPYATLETLLLRVLASVLDVRITDFCQQGCAVTVDNGHSQEQFIATISDVSHLCNILINSRMAFVSKTAEAAALTVYRSA